MKKKLFMLVLIAAVFLPTLTNFCPVPPERWPTPQDDRIPIPHFPPTHACLGQCANILIRKGKRQYCPTPFAKFINFKLREQCLHNIKRNLAEKIAPRRKFLDNRQKEITLIKNIKI